MTQSIVLGFVQGLTEFLPISSTAHLRIVPAFLGWEDPGAAFTAVTQLGTMAAILVFFRGDIARIVVAWLRGLRDPVIRKTLDSRIGWYVAVGTIPIGIFGFAFRGQIESGARNLQLIGCALIALGLVLLYAEHVATRSRGIESLTMRDGILIGVAQACALIPGVSRSGATITGGLFLGLDRTSAARYSFLLAIPAVVLSGLLELRHATEGERPRSGRDDRRDADRVRRRLRVDRISAAVPYDAFHAGVRGLPRRRRSARPRARYHGNHLLTRVVSRLSDWNR